MPEMTKAQRGAWVAALKRERDGYLQDGKKERAAAVEKELKRWDDDSDDKPKGRTAAKKATAQQD